jgi:hypothetical protein
VSLAFGLSFAYFPVRGFSIGLGLSDNLTEETSPTYEASSNVFVLSLTPAYTILFGDSPVFLYLEAQLGFGIGAGETTSRGDVPADRSTTTLDVSGLVLGGGAGLGIAIGSERGAAVSVGFSALYLDLGADYTLDGGPTQEDLDFTEVRLGLTTRLAVFF